MSPKKNLEYADDFSQKDINLDFWSTKRILPGRWEIAPRGLTEEKGILKVTIQPGDLEETGASHRLTERAELSEKSQSQIRSHSGEVWYAFSFLIPDDFVISDNRLVFAQWKQESSTRSPAMALRFKNGKVVFSVESGTRRINYETAVIETGKWHRLMMRYEINSKHEGVCEAFLDGVSFGHFTGIIGSIEDSVQMYFKMGLYRDHVPYSSSLLFAEFRRGETRELCEV